MARESYQAYCVCFGYLGCFVTYEMFLGAIESIFLEEGSFAGKVSYLDTRRLICRARGLLQKKMQFSIEDPWH